MNSRKIFFLGVLTIIGIASYNPVVGPVINNSVTYNGRVTLNTNVITTPWNAFADPPTMIDFISGTVPSGFAAPVTGTGASSLGFGTQGHFGIWQSSTGAGTTGGAALCSGGGNVGVVGGRQFALYYRFLMPTDLSDGTDTYTIIIGGSDRTTITTMQWGMWVSYTHSVNSGKWVLNTGATSINSVNSTATAPAAATWYDLLIVADAAATAVDFYISTDAGLTYTSLGQSTSQIPDGPPSGGQDTFGPYCSIVKSAGTNARILTIDRIGWGYFN